MRKLIYTALCLFLLVSPAHADIERVYVQMPILENNPIYSWEDYRTRHFIVTGHPIPLNASQNPQSTHYLSGELVKHLTQSQQDILKAEFPMVIYTDGWPVGWVNKDESE